MSYRLRKILALIVLFVGLPVYIVLAASIVGLFERPSIWVELAVYVALGMAWALPLKGLFRGLAHADPAAGDKEK